MFNNGCQGSFCPFGTQAGVYDCSVWSILPDLILHWVEGVLKITSPLNEKRKCAEDI